MNEFCDFLLFMQLSLVNVIRYGYDMLETAFEMFPDRDYCIMCLPSNHPPFPLLEHFTVSY